MKASGYLHTIFGNWTRSSSSSDYRFTGLQYVCCNLTSSSNIEFIRQFGIFCRLAKYKKDKNKSRGNLVPRVEHVSCFTDGTRIQIYNPIGPDYVQL